MKIVKSIDLWTEQKDNQDECFKGAFIDGFIDDKIPFDSYKVIKNCNCFITIDDSNLNITNKHQAVVFYKNGTPVRLLVVNRNTNLDGCINIALNQEYKDISLNYLFDLLHIERIDVDLNEKPILNQSDHTKEIDVGSCDRKELLKCMLEGSYTESDTGFGKDNIETDFSFMPEISLKYLLMTGEEVFSIEHHSAFINKDATRLIPLQDNSHLDIDEIQDKYNKSKKR